MLILLPYHGSNPNLLIPYSHCPSLGLDLQTQSPHLAYRIFFFGPCNVYIKKNCCQYFKNWKLYLKMQIPALLKNQNIWQHSTIAKMRLSFLDEAWGFQFREFLRFSDNWLTSLIGITLGLYRDFQPLLISILLTFPPT